MKLVFSLCFLGVLGVVTPLPFEPIDGILPVAGMIKGILSTDYGYQQLKTYLLNLDDNGSTGQTVRALFTAFSDAQLKVTVNQFFKNVPELAIEPGFDYPKLPTLFGELKAMLSTDEGIATLRSYVNSLETDDSILNVLLDEIKIVDDSELKDTLNVIFSGIEAVYRGMEYNVQSELTIALGHLKRIFTTAEGIKTARDFLNNMQTTNPNLILAKTVLSAMSDRSLIDLVKEATKNIPDVQVNQGDAEPGLLDLIRHAKDLAVTDEGIKVIRDYFDNFQTSNFLLVRVKGLLDKTTDEDIKKTLSKGYDEIFGGGFYGFEYSLYADDQDRQLEVIMVQIKRHVTSETGFQQLKQYLQKLVPKNPFVAIGKTFFLGMSDAEMKDVLNGFLSNFPHTDDTPVLGLAQLFAQVRPLLVSSDGLNKMRVYAGGIKSSNLIVQRLTAALQTVDDTTLINIIEDLFQGVGY